MFDYKWTSPKIKKPIPHKEVLVALTSVHPDLYFYEVSMWLPNTDTWLSLQGREVVFWKYFDGVSK